MSSALAQGSLFISRSVLSGPHAMPRQTNTCLYTPHSHLPQTAKQHCVHSRQLKRQLQAQLLQTQLEPPTI